MTAKNKKGFTLIELLTVIIIIGVLSAVAIPGYMRSVERTRATEAVQALSDIAKAENDYLYAQSRYTDDFDKLSVNIFPEASGDSYDTEFFSYTLGEESAEATRNKGEDSYTLYRLYDDPRTYCEPEGNKYCEMLDLPAGSFGASACPEGYTCSDTGAMNGCASGYYMDFNSGTCGTSCPSGFTCNGDTMTDSGTCANATDYVCIISATYNASGKKISELRCTYYSQGRCEDDMFYLASFNEQGDEISLCNVKYSSCSNYAYTYDEDGNKLTKLTTSDGYSQVLTTYNYSGGELVSSTESHRRCATSNSDGSCATFKYDQYGTYNETISYDASEKPTTKVRRNCASINSQTGECETYREKLNCTLKPSYWDCGYVCSQYTINPITGDC